MAEQANPSGTNDEREKNGPELNLPNIWASMTLDPPVHSFSNDAPPNLILTLMSTHHKPITIYANDLSPAHMVRHGAFRIINFGTGEDVRQYTRTYCKIPPPSKVNIPLREALFHTLIPNTPLTFSAPFGPDQKPRSSSDSTSKDGLRTYHRSQGVDGLAAGGRYLLVAVENPRSHWNLISWWEYGTKDEVLNSPKGKLDGRKVAYKPGPHQEIVIDPKSVNPVQFECQD